MIETIVSTLGLIWIVGIVLLILIMLWDGRNW